MWIGGVRYQFARRNAATAAMPAIHAPPIAAMITMSSRYSSRSLLSDRSSRTLVRNTVSSGRPNNATSDPATCRWRETPREIRSGGRPVGSSSPSSRVEITCTSMSPDARTTRLMNEPRTSSAQRDLRLDPSTSCVACSLRANVTSVCAGSAPTHVVIRPAEILEQPAVAFEQPGWRSGEALARTHVDAQQFALRPARHARGPAHEVLTARRARERDDDPLSRLPRGGDAVVLHVLLEALVDLVGDPEQRELAQRREVAGPEVVGERGVDLLRPVDVAVRHPPPQRLGAHVDELHLVGTPHHRVGQRLFCSMPVIRSTTSFTDSRCWMLTVEITSIPASSRSSTSCHRFSCFDAGDVRVRELVDEHLLGPATQDRRRRPSPRTRPRDTRCAGAG